MASDTETAWEVDAEMKKVLKTENLEVSSNRVILFSPNRCVAFLIFHAKTVQ